MPQIFHTPSVVATSIVALQAASLVVVSALLSVQEAVIVVHGFGFSSPSKKKEKKRELINPPFIK
jgi:hypothetical protein